MEHIFGDIRKELEQLKIRDMFKIVGSYKGGSYEEIDIANTKERAKYLLEKYRLSYGNDWNIIFYKID